MKKLFSVFLILSSAVLFIAAQPLPPGVIAFPGMEGPYCYTGKVGECDDTDCEAEVIFTNNGFKIEIPVAKNYPHVPACGGQSFDKLLDSLTLGH